MSKTKFNEQQIEEMKKSVVGKKVTDLYYEKDDDYFVMEFEGGAETSFRFMADLKTIKI